MSDLSKDIKLLSKAVESISKRLRLVEVLARLGRNDLVTTFTGLEDTPDDYTGRAGWIPVVNDAETGLEWGLTEGACVAFECGSPGWRGTGGSPSRTLVHETAFQLDDGGDDRGLNAIDLQVARFFDSDVAAAELSTILGGEGNSVSAIGDYSILIGSFNGVSQDGANCWALGEANDFYGSAGGAYAVGVLGFGCQIADSNYGTYGGYNNDSTDAFHWTVFGEGNDNDSNLNDGSYYCKTIGILNTITGDVFEGFQEGESNSLIGDGTGVGDDLWMCWQFGYGNGIMDARGYNVFQFGRQMTSYRPVGSSDQYFNGRLMLNGDGPQELSTNTPNSLGMNQVSLFSQSTAIDTWPSGWTTSRFQFPIIEDSIWYFDAMIGGTELGCANTYAWRIEGVVANDGGVMRIENAVITNFHRGVVTKEWQVATTADRLIFQYRDTAGPDSTRSNIHFRMKSVEVGYEY